MGETSKIEWTEATWNPWHGCHKVSAGCKNCYMFREKKQYGQDPNVVVRSKTKFNDPLKWKEPRKIFTCSWSDFFIEEADPWRDEAFAIMALTPQHTYQVLTKRPERMLEYLTDKWVRDRIHTKANEIAIKLPGKLWDEFYAYPEGMPWPLPNVQLGVSVEDQKTADERIPLLLHTPAALRWLSIEPLLGPVELGRAHPCGYYCDPDEYGGGHHDHDFKTPQINTSIQWIVVGGESGHDARPMHPDWARSLRDQCTAAGVPFFFKQWGEWAPDASIGGETIDYRGKFQPLFPSINDDCVEPRCGVRKVGKTKAGRTLDGREWNEMPEVPRCR
jgi:protein gp37